MGMEVDVGLVAATFCYKNFPLRNDFPRKLSPQESFCYKNFPLRNKFHRGFCPQKLISEGEILAQLFVPVERGLAAPRASSWMALHWEWEWKWMWGL